MSKETSQWLNQNVLIGYTDKRGTAWHYRASSQGDEANHYPGPIPVDDVHRRLFNWSPIEAPLQATFDDGSQITDPGRKVIARPDTGDVLGVFKSGYRVHNYDRWLIDNVEGILDADLAVGSAGLLRNGAVGWVQVEMEDTVETKGVQFRPFLTAVTSLDGSFATTYRTGAQLVVCDNTLQSAVADQEAASFKVKHSAHSLGRLQDARDALGVMYSVADDFSEEVRKLTEEQVSDRRMEQFITKYTQPVSASKVAETKARKEADALRKLWQEDQRAEPWAGTAFGVVAAVNTHQHHNVVPRGRSRAERNAELTCRGAWASTDRETLRVLASV